MPYFNGLIAKYGLATQYYADTHPSLPNYFMLTTGATIATDDRFSGTVTQDNAIRAHRLEENLEVLRRKPSITGIRGAECLSVH